MDLKNSLENSHGILITNNEKIYVFPNKDSKQIALVKADYILEVIRCRKEWCKVEDKKVSGWIKKRSLWGFISD